jgi:ABC-type lipoprotein release transport system permease subunit
MNWLLLFGGLMLAAYAVLIILAARRPLFARIAAREALRRPWQSALLVAGLMIGTGTILSTQVLDDSAADSLAAGAARGWGHVDLTITAAGNGYFNQDVTAAIASDQEVRPRAEGVQAGLEQIGAVADLDAGRSVSFIRVIGFDPASQPAFGAFKLANGVASFGTNLSLGQVYVGRSLATALAAKAGDRLQILVDQRGPQSSASFPLIVAGIVEPSGPGAYGLRPAIYAPVRTIQRVLRTDQINVIRIAARSGVMEASAAHTLAGRIRSVLAALPNGQGLTVWESKADEVAAALHGQDTGGGGGGGPSAFAWFVVLAGLVLVLNLIVTLVEERRPRLAVLRALGLSRAGLVTILSTEGALYSLLGGLLGCLPGVLLGAALFHGWATAPSDSVIGQGGTSPAAGRDLQLFLSVRPQAVALAIAAGTVVTLATIVVAAILCSGITVAAGIRDLPEPSEAHRHPWRRRAALSGLALASLIGLLLSTSASRMLGGGLLIATAALAARGRLPDRWRMTLGGIGVALWSVLDAAVSVARPASAGDVYLAVLVGIPVSVFALALAVAPNLRLLERLAVGARWQALLRPTLAYMTRRPFRAGLTIGIFALLLSIIVLYNQLLVTTSARRPLQPYDIRVVSLTRPAIHLPASIQREIASSLAIPTRTYLGAVRIGAGGPGQPSPYWHPERIALYELPPNLLAPSLFGSIQNRSTPFGSDAAAWRAVQQRPSWVFWTRYITNATLTLPAANGPVTFQVAGDVGDPTLDGVIGSPAALAPFGNLPLGTTLMLQTRPGFDPEAVAQQLRRETVRDGFEILTVRDISLRQSKALHAFIAVPNLYMWAGLIVGILSLGILALRAAIQRRRAIGVLRALGYRRRDLAAGNFSEATLTTTASVAVALVIGPLVSTTVVKYSTGSGWKLALDVPGLAVGLLIMYLAVVVAAIGPAWSTGRIPPAQALRLVE